MPKKTAAPKAGKTEARVLVACAWGQVNDVVPVSTEDAAAGLAAGELDPSPEAVAYAKSLTQE
jgi:hypothetical protein